MNKYLMMSAAAALATSVASRSSAQSGSYSVHYGTSSGQSYCDGLIGHYFVSGKNNKVFFGHHTYTTCGYSNNVAVLGLGEKQKGNPVGKNNVVFSDASAEFFYGNENYAFLYDIHNPIKAGNKWDEWVFFFGTSVFLGNEGVLLPGQFTKHKPGHKDLSTVSRLIETLNAKPVVVSK